MRGFLYLRVPRAVSEMRMTGTHKTPPRGFRPKRLRFVSRAKRLLHRSAVFSTSDLVGGGLNKGGFADDDVSNLLIGGKRFQCGKYVALQFCFERFLAFLFQKLGVDNALNGKAFLFAKLVSVGINDIFENVGDTADIILKLLGIDILTVAEDDDVLLTAGDHNLTLLGKLAVVTGTEIAVLGEYLLGSFLVLVIAEHYDIALNADFALVILVGLVDANVNASHREADSLGIVYKVVVDRNERRAFGDTVAVGNDDTDIFKEIGDFRTQRRTAANDLFKIAAKRVVKLGKDLTSDIDTDMTEKTGEPDTGTNRLGLALFLDACVHSAVKNLHKRGNYVHILRLIERKVLDDSLERVVDAKRRVAVDRNENTRNRFIRMVVRKHRKSDVADGGELQAVLNKRKNVVLGKHNALCDTGRARGVDEHLHLLEIVVLHILEGLVAVFVELLALGDELVEGKIFSFVLFAVKADEIFYVGNLIADTLEGFLALFIAEDDIVVTVIDNIYKVGIGKLLVDGTENALALKRRKVNEYPVVAVLARAGYMSLSKAEILDSGAESHYFVLKFFKGDLAHTLARCAEFKRNLVARLAHCVGGKILKVANRSELGGMDTDLVSHHIEISPRIFIITKSIISGFENYVKRF